jgi:DNA-binding NarL/FixJ family response regulator
MQIKKYRALIADDHEVVSMAYRLLLEKAGIEVADVVSTGRQAVDAALSLEPDVVLLDVVMPDMDGLAALTVIKYLRPDMHLFVLTAHGEKEYMARAIELGATAFFTKNVSPNKLVESLISVLSGKIAPEPQPQLEPPQAPTIPGLAIPTPEQPIEDDLTEQEKLVLTLLSMGCNTRDITEQLVVSRNTLKSHLSNIYRKIGVSDRTQAAIWAIRKGYGPYGQNGRETTNT